MLPAPLIVGILTITWPYTRGTAVLAMIAVTSGAINTSQVGTLGPSSSQARSRDRVGETRT